MTSHDVTLVGYGLILACGVVVESAARRRGSVVPTLDTLVRWVLQTRSGRIGVYAAWAWIGLHFLG
jgi:hypothetical protein